METECSQPVPVRKAGRVFLARCRWCPQCLKAAQRYWSAAAANQIRIADADGCRSWFGTCTFRPDVQDRFILEAVKAAAAKNVAWAELASAEQFYRLQKHALLEVQKYWKRLRGKGLAFRYLATFEEDLTGKPHMHCLVHEADSKRPIRKRELDESWGLGFTSYKLLKLGPSGRLPHGAITYVTKSLATQRGSRICASFDYRPERRREPGGQKRQLPLLMGMK